VAPATLPAAWPSWKRAPSEPRRSVGRCGRRSEPGDRVAQVQQHLGDAAHPRAADPDEVDVLDLRSTSSPPFQEVRHARAASGRPSRREASSMDSSRPGSSSTPATARARTPRSGPSPPPSAPRPPPPWPARWCAGGRPPPRRRGRGPPPCPPAVSSAQVVAPAAGEDEVAWANRISMSSRKATTSPRGRRPRRPRPPRRAWPLRSGGRCADARRATAGAGPGQRAVQDPRALAPAEGEEVRGSRCSLRGREANPPRTGLPRQDSLAPKKRRASSYATGGLPREGPEHLVREAGLRVRLQDHRAYSHERGHQDQRAAGVATHAEDGPRPLAPEEGRGAQEGAGQGQEAPQRSRPAHAFEGQDGEELQRVARARHDAGLQPARRAHEHDAGAGVAAQELVRHRDCRGRGGPRCRRLR
jgi:hypothetical protein